MNVTNSSMSSNIEETDKNYISRFVFRAEIWTLFSISCFLSMDTITDIDCYHIVPEIQGIDFNFVLHVVIIILYYVFLQLHNILELANILDRTCLLKQQHYTCSVITISEKC